MLLSAGVAALLALAVPVRSTATSAFPSPGSASYEYVGESQTAWLSYLHGLTSDRSRRRRHGWPDHRRSPRRRRQVRRRGRGRRLGHRYGQPDHRPRLCLLQPSSGAHRILSPHPAAGLAAPVPAADGRQQPQGALRRRQDPGWHLGRQHHGLPSLHQADPRPLGHHCRPHQLHLEQHAAVLHPVEHPHAPRLDQAQHAQRQLHL